MKNFFAKIKSLFSKIWYVLFIPVGLFFIKLAKGSKNKELKKEIKETTKEIKQDLKEIDKKEEEIQNIEATLEQQVQEVEEIVSTPSIQSDDKIYEILPGLKK